MDSMGLVRRITELQETAGTGRVPVKFRVQVGAADGVRTVVLDLEPGMVQLKDWGSDGGATVLIDLT